MLKILQEVLHFIEMVTFLLIKFFFKFIFKYLGYTNIAGNFDYALSSNCDID